MAAGATGAADRVRDGAGRRPPGGLYFAYLLFVLAIYLPAFPGGPISDDQGFLMNPYVTRFSAGDALGLIDPRSDATLTLRNYAPLRPLVHALQWRLFPQNATAYHATNVVLHALACWLLVRLLQQSGVALVAAILAGFFFAAHPANVEAVAWMSQTWSAGALCLGLGALLCQRRRPALALLLFGLALLMRPTSVSIWPAAILREWAWRNDPHTSPRRWLWMLPWGVLLAAVASAQVQVFDASGAAAAQAHPDALVRARTIVATAGRYLVMAVTGQRVSAFQEPSPAVSWLDPWWLLGLAATLLLAARGLACMRQRREEAAWWAWAAAAFVPVSQLFPFLYPMADRYLYFMLPGLLGGALLWGGELAGRIRDPLRRRTAGRVALGMAALAIASFAVTSFGRAALWTSEDRVLADAARHYPDGVSANLLRARRAASEGDVDAAIAALDACRARGWDYYGYLLAHPAFEPVRATPRFQALLREFAGDRIAAAARRPRLTQPDLRDLAEAHRLRGETPQAVAALDRALALGGPLDAELRPALAQARAELSKHEGGGSP